MRKVVKSVVLMSLMVSLAMPASAAQRERSTSILQIVKRFIVRTFGDGLIDPKPKTSDAKATGDILTNSKP